MIITRTPLRISLVGGGTDFESFYNQDANVPGAVVSFAIDKFVYVVLNEKFDGQFRVSYSQTENVHSVDQIKHDIIREAIKIVRRVQRGVEIVTIADIPGGGTGLGSSSSLAVGVVQALNAYISGPLEHPAALAEIAYMVEKQKCGNSVGKQDHYAAAYGGMNLMTFTRGQTFATVTSTLGCKWDSDHYWDLKMLGKNLLLLWTGTTRSAQTILKEQGAGMGEKERYAIGKEMTSVVRQLWDGLQNTAFRNLGICLRKDWELKKMLHKDISNPQIDMWYELAMRNGAKGGKLCGAGGGGFLLFYAPPDAHKRIENATGLRKVDFKICLSGSEVVYNDRNRISNEST